MNRLATLRHLFAALEHALASGSARALELVRRAIERFHALAPVLA